jgi:hypothetical protein
MAIAPFRPVRTNIRASSGSAAAAAMRQIEDNFKQWTLHLTGQSGEVLRQALMPTLSKAKRYCPYKTGDLRNSGYVEVARTGRLGSYEAEIGFGRGGFPSYTIFVHEMPYQHAAPTRWKFLQIALVEDQSRIRQALAGGFRRAAGV